MNIFTRITRTANGQPNWDAIINSTKSMSTPAKRSYRLIMPVKKERPLKKRTLNDMETVYTTMKNDLDWHRTSELKGGQAFSLPLPHDATTTTTTELVEKWWLADNKNQSQII